MLARAVRSMVIVALLAAIAGQGGAQVGNQSPKPQVTPGMSERLQQMLQSSGMTPDQIRARLKAQGYSDSLLDQYLPGAKITDSTAVPGEEAFAAVRTLGLTDSLPLDSLSRLAKGKRKERAATDSAFLDTLQRALKNDTTASAIRALLRSRDLQRQQADSGFSVFGLDIFQGETTQFDGSQAAGADPNYRFGVGDRLVLFLTGDVERSYALTVNGEGFVVMPDVGAINVAGLTREQLEDLLYARLGRVYSGIRRSPNASTRFFVDVGRIGMSQVYLHGDVTHPGSYRVSRAGTVMSALYAAGGVTANGSLRNVEVRRGGRLLTTLDVYDYAVRGNATNDVRLETGDIIFVPPHGPRVRVAGAVLRPATYELKANESLGDIVSAAGGFTAMADRRRIQVVRIAPVGPRESTESARHVLDVPVSAIAAFKLSPGDVVGVAEIPNRLANRVTVKGDVWSPGFVGFAGGMTLYDALRQAGGLRPDAFLGDVLVTRVHPDSTREMLRTALRDTTGRPINNLALSDGDEIQVFSSTEMRPKQYVTVGGAVQKPGTKIIYREGMTLRDAVLLAGGLQEGASFSEAEISRLPENREDGLTAIASRVTLDSAYLVARGGRGGQVEPAGVLTASGEVTSSRDGAPPASSPPVFLRPYDVITIKWQPGWSLQQIVVVRGEVKYPGDYALTSRTERLSDILTRAGGLTSSSYAGGMVLIRTKGNIGRIGIDVPTVLKNPNSNDNIQLVDGDSIFVPRFNPVVVVKGEVNAPVGMSYSEGADLAHYVRAAGGANAKGDGGRAYVAQPDGKIETASRRFLFFRNEPHPRPGSTVIVPMKDTTDRHDWAQLATVSTSIFGSIIALYAILKR